LDALNRSPITSGFLLSQRVRDRTQIRQIWALGFQHQAVAFRPNANRQARFADFLAHRD
jgi:hypothetical protein